MENRRYTDINIMRPSQGGGMAETIATVPITERSSRRYMLMEDDSVTLEFSLANAVDFAIGDYIDDEVFGRFYIFAEQAGKYNTSTGGYDYSLKFEREYMGWRNRVHCLTIDGDRKECDWSLTDSLKTHAQQVADEANVLLGMVDEGDRYVIDITAETANEVKHVKYSGVSILEALNMIADAWQCEWWVTYDKPYREPQMGRIYYKVIHFGKMEYGSTPLEFRLGENVESMEVSRDQQTYCNRLYAYGGTQNVPETYNRKLEFEVDILRFIDGTAIYGDSKRPLRMDMLNADAVADTYTYVLMLDGLNRPQAVCRTALTAGKYSLEGTLTSIYTCRVINGGTLYASLALIIDGNTVNLPATSRKVFGEETTSPGVQDFEYGIDLAKVRYEGNGITIINGVLTLEETMTLAFRISWPSMNGTEVLQIDGVKATAIDNRTKKRIQIEYGGQQHYVTVNPAYSADSVESACFAFDGAVPSGFAVGSKYTISPRWLTLDVPISYYTPLYDAGTMSQVGSRRIHLPVDRAPHGYVGQSNYTPKQIVEMAVVFDDVFPRLELKVDSVRQVSRTMEVEHEDGSKTYERRQQYLIKCSMLDGSPFNFSYKYLMDGQRLKAHFTAPFTLQTAGYKLAGMEFELGLNTNGEYTIIRNEDYGAMLPNDLLMPSVGDTLFFSGWNPQAMYELNLVNNAEYTLLSEAHGYLSAITAGQFTARCRMMSDWPFEQTRERAFIDADGKAFMVKRSASSNTRVPFRINGIETTYLLPDAGDRVTVYNDSITGGSMTSRIIGYEYKLDMPYDTPTYIIGETEAYSRLKQIEKRITKLS